MLDNEGSVEVDGEGFEDPESGESEEEATNEGIEENQAAEAENLDNQEENAEKETEGEESSEDSGEAKEGEETEGEEEGETTDKGTKLDSDPMSQANQLRANAEARAKEMEDFFSDPKNVKSYLAELEKETGGEEEEEEDLIDDPSKIETTADLQSYAKHLDRKMTKELEAIKGKQQQDEAEKAAERTVSRVTTQISEVKSKYPELRALNSDGTANPDFDKDLEAELGGLIFDLDFDPSITNADGSKGNFRGNIDYIKVTDRFMKAARRGENRGSKKAQTIIKDKSGGRIRGGGSASDAQPDESSMTPSQMIASRMARARGARR